MKKNLAVFIVLVMSLGVGCAGSADAEKDAKSSATSKETSEQALRQAIEQDKSWLEKSARSAPALEVLEAHARIARNEGELGNDMESALWRERTLQMANKFEVAPASPEAALAAEAMFYLLEPKYEQWSAIAFEGDIKAQHMLVQDKIKGQRALQQEYTAIMAYESPRWNIASTYRIAGLLHEFARSLWAAEIPFEQGSQEHGIYKQQLHELAVPLLDKADELYAQTLTYADEQGMQEDEWAILARQARAELEEERAAH
jgi:hypothetical protein